MFGLEGQQGKKKGTEYIFDLEKELKNKNEHAKIKKNVEERIQQIKAILRSGEDKEEFDTYGILLHGYTSLLKVLGRFSGK